MEIYFPKMKIKSRLNTKKRREICHPHKGAKYTLFPYSLFNLKESPRNRGGCKASPQPPNGRAAFECCCFCFLLPDWNQGNSNFVLTEPKPVNKCNQAGRLLIHLLIRIRVVGSKHNSYTLCFVPTSSKAI